MSPSRLRCSSRSCRVNPQVQPAIKGIQSKGVIANAKHYVNNNQVRRRPLPRAASASRRPLPRAGLCLCLAPVFFVALHLSPRHLTGRPPPFCRRLHCRRPSAPPSLRMSTSASSLRCTTLPSRAPLTPMLAASCAGRPLERPSLQKMSSARQHVLPPLRLAPFLPATTRLTRLGRVRTTAPLARTSRYGRVQRLPCAAPPTEVTRSHPPNPPRAHFPDYHAAAEARLGDERLGRHAQHLHQPG